MNPRFVVSVSDPMNVTLLASRKEMGTVINRHPEPIHPQVHPLERDKETCLHVETDGFGAVTKRCFHKVHPGRSGFLCKMHHDLNVKLKPQYRTITTDESDWEEAKLRERIRREVSASRGNVSIDYANYVQWGWARQPMIFVEDASGQMVQTFSDPADFEED